MDTPQAHPSEASTLPIENPHGNVGITVFAEQLSVGQIYQFQIRDWETPEGDVIAGTVKTRKYLGPDVLGPEIGQWPTMFLSVERQNGTTHRIAAHTIAQALPVSDFS